MRVCYQVHTHRAPAQIYRLVATLVRASRDCIVVISHDRAGPELDSAALTKLGDVHVQLTDGGYGDWSHINRYLEVADLLDTRGIGYDWMVNLSGQDYPVTPLATAEAELAAARVGRDGGESTVDGFLLTFPVESPDAPWPLHRSRSRYWYRYRRLKEISARSRRLLRPVHVVNRVQSLARVNVSFGLSAGVRTRAPFGPGLVCHGGSFWCTLSRRAVEEIRTFTRARPDVVAHYQRTLAPEESYFQTVLANSRGIRLSTECLRYFDFTDSRFNHPKTLAEADVERAVASGAHFARKWDFDRSPAAYDALDEIVLQR
jgi:hypothetical protein